MNSAQQAAAERGPMPELGKILAIQIFL